MTFVRSKLIAMHEQESDRRRWTIALQPAGRLSSPLTQVHHNAHPVILLGGRDYDLSR
jgi:hypothetical protein